MSVTFPVSEVSLGEPNKWTQVDLPEIIKQSVKISPEACGSNVGTAFLADARAV